MTISTPCPHLSMRISEPSKRHEDAINEFDAADNDVATFLYAEYTTVAQSYAQALSFAQMLVAAAR